MLSDLGFLLIIIAAVLVSVCALFSQLRSQENLIRFFCTTITVVATAGVTVFIVADTQLLKDGEAGIMVATVVTIAVAIGTYLITSKLFVDGGAEASKSASETTKTVAKIDKKNFWHNFAKDAAKAEPGTYKVDADGHLTRKSKNLD